MSTLPQVLPQPLDIEILQRRLDAQQRVITELITELVCQGHWSPNRARTAIFDMTDA